MNTPADVALRAAWRERVDAGPEGACPDAAALWTSANGTAPAPQRDAVAEHAMRCPSCAEAWRLARALGDGDRVGGSRAARGRAARRWLATAAALVAASAALFVVLRQVPPGGPALRAPVIEPPRATIADGAALPREAFRLAWSAGPAGTVYDVEVGTPGLRILDRAHALEQPEYTVPAKALAGLASGATVAWRVVATWPDGRTAASITFVNRVR
ncbi:MAG: hypothetical protein KBD01_16220 [Acidobacteria bacterium]|nr:hypothetical protein [Acidobacteriota bacterium]